MTTLPRRLARLEKIASPGAVFHLWQDAGTDVIARQFPEGVPEGTSVVLYRWADGEPTETQSVSRGAEAPGR